VPTAAAGPPAANATPSAPPSEGSAKQLLNYLLDP
jgi:hypothetical protein